VHTSPSWTQYEDAVEHTPPLQNPEQQSALLPHGLPPDLQPVLSGLHTPPPVPFGTQSPPQQSLFVPQLPLSATHWRFAHVPLALQEPVQHSLPTVQP
jgi:hypothetical protein